MHIALPMITDCDDRGRLEHKKFHHPKLVDIEPANAPPNAPGLRSVICAVEDVGNTVAVPCVRRRIHGRGLSVRSFLRTLFHASPCRQSLWPRNLPEAIPASWNLAPRLAGFRLRPLAIPTQTRCRNRQRVCVAVGQSWLSGKRRTPCRLSDTRGCSRSWPGRSRLPARGRSRHRGRRRQSDA